MTAAERPEDAQGPSLAADREVVDYTKWTKEDLLRLRGLQRDEGATPEETDDVEREILRRAPAPAPAPPRAVAPAAAVASVAALGPADGRTHIAPAASSDSSAKQETGEDPPFSLSDTAPNRHTFVRGLTVWLVFVALATGVGVAIALYSALDGMGSARLPITLIAAVATATPYLGVIAFLLLVSEVAQGVTWISGFLQTTRSDGRD